MTLQSLKCIPCQIGEPTLTKEEVNKYLPTLKKDWQIEADKKLVIEFNFSDFAKAIDFINKVAKIAEEEGHHPDFQLFDYNKVKLYLWTHKIGGLHKNDFILASKIEQLV